MKNVTRPNLPGEDFTKKRTKVMIKFESLRRNFKSRDKKIRTNLEKADFAEELQKEVDSLLSCPDYNEKSEDCSNCHFIANMCKKTADLVIKAKKLA
ncbi:MAG: hypothetical protein ABR969_00940 [Sedimentisphaerales bacterium]|jgi:hypothetical protein